MPDNLTNYYAFAYLMDYSSELIIFFDLNGQVLLVNKAFEQFTHTSKTNLMKQHWGDLAKSLSLDVFSKKPLPEILSSLPISEVERHYTGNNQEQYVNWSFLPLINNNKITDGLILIGKDITTLKMLAANVERLDNIIKYVPAMIYWKDKNSIHLGCNDPFAIAAGYQNRNEIIGKSDHDFPWREEADKYNLDDREVIESGEPRLNIEDVMPFKNGKKAIVITNKVPLRDSRGNIVGVLGIATDITHQKAVERSLSITKQAAEAANQAKTAFIANMSHDIRTPLTGVVGMSQMLEDGLQNLEQKQYAQWIHQSGDQLLSLLNGILDVVSAEQVNERDIQNETFDLHQFIKDIIQLEHPSTELKGISLNSLIDSRVPVYVHTDRKKLHRIILNLIGNAIKFTNVGSVSIEVHNDVLNDKKVRLLFRVTDTGIGIPSGLQDKVFDRFFRVDPSYKGGYEGYGIGLHIAQSYVALLGGDLKLTSKEGIGTSFYFDLICQIGRAEDIVRGKAALLAPPDKLVSDISLTHAPKIITAKNQEVPENSPSLLLIEDNCVALKILESMAKQANVRYTSAVDGESALELAKTQSYNLIISDIGLPGISGNEFTHQFRIWEATHHKKPVPIVGLTAHAQGEIREECLQSGMNDVFSKPMLLPVLKEIIFMYVSTITESEKTKDKYKQKVGSGKLGRDLPDTEDLLFMLDVFPVLDVKSALEGIGNNKELLTDILQSMVNQEIPTERAAIQAAYTKKDWNMVERLAHKMKGGSVYAGVTKLQYACQYFERYCKAGHTKLLDQLYQQMLSTFDETHEAITQWMKIDKH
ncbi:MAG: ATP-binding protein [Legionellaceae bacterium]|nr:ATP-binding protein [Legionellaceae bacterium]